MSAARAQDAAGNVLFASGQAGALRAGTVLVLARGAEVYPGDTLVTADGRLQIRFNDGGTVSLSPHGRFRIDEYRYAGSPDGSERGLFSLLKGSIRAITGAIGKTRRDDYRVDAVVATIGIRGTAYKAQLCQGDCRESDGTARRDGLYLVANSGVVALTNPAGTLDVSAGQSAFVADLQTAPALTERPAEIPNVPLPGAEPEFRAGEQSFPEPGGHHDHP
ncbi:MAG: FecR domain-containing protein [Gammaproteobacteria bacterium]|nr:FecR domain-containing protein [Gammaproteobacteria bacterium]